MPERDAAAAADAAVSRDAAAVPRCRACGEVSHKLSHTRCRMHLEFLTSIVTKDRVVAAYMHPDSTVHRHVDLLTSLAVPR